MHHKSHFDFSKGQDGTSIQYQSVTLKVCLNISLYKRVVWWFRWKKKALLNRKYSFCSNLDTKFNPHFKIHICIWSSFKKVICINAQFICAVLLILEKLLTNCCPGLHVSAAMIETDLYMRSNQTLAWKFIILSGGEGVEGGGGRWHLAKGGKDKVNK